MGAWRYFKMKSGDIVKINNKAASHYKRAGSPLIKIDLIGRNLTVEDCEWCDDGEIKVEECEYLFYKYELELLTNKAKEIKCSQKKVISN